MRYAILLVILTFLVIPAVRAQDTAPTISTEGLELAVLDAVPEYGYNVNITTHEAHGMLYTVVTYCYDMPNESDPLTEPPPNYEMLMGVYIDGRFDVLLEDTAATRRYEGWWQYDKIEFGQLLSDGDYIDIMVVSGSDWGGGTGQWPFIYAYQLDFNYWEIYFSPGMMIGDRRRIDFEISEDMNGLLTWETCAVDGDGRFPPWRLTQSLWRLNTWANAEFYMMKRETSEDGFEEFPDEPPIQWVPTPVYE